MYVSGNSIFAAVQHIQIRGAKELRKYVYVYMCVCETTDHA